MKKLIAYSSVAHMGYVTLGIFTLTEQGIEGAMFQMISHGIISAALFLCVGVIYDRMHTREISAYGGVVNTMPKFAALMVLFGLANAGLPGTSGFVGEFFVILGTFHSSAWLAFFAATTLILGAAYTLWMIKRVFYGPAGVLSQSKAYPLKDMTLREWAIAVPLVIMVVWMGVRPNSFVNIAKSSIDHLITDKDNYTLMRDR